VNCRGWSTPSGIRTSTVTYWPATAGVIGVPSAGSRVIAVVVVPVCSLAATRNGAKTTLFAWPA
jgi:hypothetical protein